MCLTLKEGEKVRPALLTWGSYPERCPSHSSRQEASNQESKFLLRSNEGRAKSHGEIAMSYGSSSLFHKLKNTKSVGKESPNFLFFEKQSCLRVISNQKEDTKEPTHLFDVVQQRTPLDKMHNSTFSFMTKNLPAYKGKEVYNCMKELSFLPPLLFCFPTTFYLYPIAQIEFKQIKKLRIIQQNAFPHYLAALRRGFDIDMNNKGGL